MNICINCKSCETQLETEFKWGSHQYESEPKDDIIIAATNANTSKSMNKPEKTQILPTNQTKSFFERYNPETFKALASTQNSRGLGFISDVMGLLDIFGLLPDFGDDNSEILDALEEQQKLLQDILDGQLAIQDAIDDAVEQGQDMGDEIINSINDGVNDINDSISNVSDQINDIQGYTAQLINELHQEMMIQFTSVKANQVAMMQELEVIEDAIAELSEQIDQLSAKVDWDNIVSLLAPYIQSIEYLYDCFSNMPTMNEPLTHPNREGESTQISNYFRLREWAHAVMDFNNGIPQMLDALDRMIMGSSVLVPSLLRRLYKLLQEHPNLPVSRLEACQSYYINLAMVQVKGFMCIDAASGILQISNPYEDLVAPRIWQQLAELYRQFEISVNTVPDMVPSPQQGSFIELGPWEEDIGVNSDEAVALEHPLLNLILNNNVPFDEHYAQMTIGDIHEYGIVNFVLFGPNPSLTIAKYINPSKIDTTSIIKLPLSGDGWENMKTSLKVLVLTNSSSCYESCYAIQKDPWEIPLQSVIVGLTIRKFFDYGVDRDKLYHHLRLDITYAMLSEDEGILRWSDDQLYVLKLDSHGPYTEELEQKYDLFPEFYGQKSQICLWEDDPGVPYDNHIARIGFNIEKEQNECGDIKLSFLTSPGHSLDFFLPPAGQSDISDSPAEGELASYKGLPENKLSQKKNDNHYD